MMKCAEAAASLEAYVDRETDWVHALALRRHLRGCPRCAAEHDGLVALRARIRAEVPRFSAPPALRARVRATLEGAHAAAPARDRATPGRWNWFTSGALSGCLAMALAWFIGTTVIDWRANEDIAVEAVGAHVRATLGNQLIQVASSDQHTVKPWLSARLDYSPPVPDLAKHGFALLGGRIDYVEQRPVATLVYRFRNHTIDVYVRPEPSRAAPPTLRNVRGFNVTHATGGAMDWLAVSDASPDVLIAFVEQLATASGARD
jgi:anti-sigma factor (TIGR02949 family)